MHADGKLLRKLDDVGAPDEKTPNVISTVSADIFVLFSSLDSNASVFCEKWYTYNFVVSRVIK